MTAPARRNDAATFLVSHRTKNAHDLWQDAVRFRQEWLDHGLSTQPADRPTPNAA